MFIIKYHISFDVYITVKKFNFFHSDNGSFKFLTVSFIVKFGKKKTAMNKAVIHSMSGAKWLHKKQTNDKSVIMN